MSAGAVWRGVPPRGPSGAAAQPAGLTSLWRSCIHPALEESNSFLLPPFPPSLTSWIPLSCPVPPHRHVRVPRSPCAGRAQPGDQLCRIRDAAVQLAGGRGTRHANGEAPARQGWATRAARLRRDQPPSAELRWIHMLPQRWRCPGSRCAMSVPQLLLPPPHPPLQVGMSLACGSAAGLVSSTATFPLDLIRRRLQLRGQGGGGGGATPATFAATFRSVVQVRAPAVGCRGSGPGTALPCSAVTQPECT